MGERLLAIEKNCNRHRPFKLKSKALKIAPHHSSTSLIDDAMTKYGCVVALWVKSYFYSGNK